MRLLSRILTSRLAWTCWFVLCLVLAFSTTDNGGFIFSAGVSAVMIVMLSLFPSNPN